ncbi:MAG: hypothetical protein ABFD77_02515 [Thermotogota bacterium]
MERFNRQCPFCGGRIEVFDVTEPERRAVGLVYLRTRCVPCDARIEAAGIGEEDATRNLDKNISMRVGTEPGQWRILQNRLEKRKRGR